jgi:hypothetical protein
MFSFFFCQCHPLALLGKKVLLVMDISKSFLPNKVYFHFLFLCFHFLVILIHQVYDCICSSFMMCSLMVFSKYVVVFYFSFLLSFPIFFSTPLLSYLLFKKVFYFACRHEVRACWKTRMRLNGERGNCWKTAKGLLHGHSFFAFQSFISFQFFFPLHISFLFTEKRIEEKKGKNKS